MASSDLAGVLAGGQADVARQGVESEGLSRLQGRAARISAADHSLSDFPSLCMT